MGKGRRRHGQALEGTEVTTKEGYEGCTLQSTSEVFSGRGSMSTSTYSSSAPWSFTSELDSFSDEEPNAARGFKGVCVAESYARCFFRVILALDLLTLGEVQVARVPSGAGEHPLKGKPSCLVRFV